MREAANDSNAGAVEGGVFARARAASETTATAKKTTCSSGILMRLVNDFLHLVIKKV